MRFNNAADDPGSATTCAGCGLALVEGPEPVEALVPAETGEPAVRAMLLPKAESGEWVRRLGVSLTAMVAAAFSTSVRLPGVLLERVSELEASLEMGGRLWEMVSVFGLGLLPFVFSFLLIELVALLVPRWRGLRTGGPAGRARLRKATVVVGVGLALLYSLLQLQFIKYRHGQHMLFAYDGMPPEPVIVLLLTGGVVLLHLLTVGVERYGLGNGYAVVLLGLSLPSVYGLAAGLFTMTSTEQLSLPSMGGVLFGILVLLWSMVWILRGREARAGKGDEAPVSLRLPTSGLVPVGLVLVPLAMLILMGRLEGPMGEVGRFLESHWPVEVLLSIVLSTLLAMAFSVLFHRPRRVAALWAELTAKDEAARALVQGRVILRIRELLPTATAWSVVLLLLTWLPSRLATLLLGVPLPNMSGLLLGMAIILDLLDEARMRREGTWVAVWPMHRVYEVEPTLAMLSAAGIPAWARGTNARALHQFFGPYFAIDLMVPPQRADEARAVLSARSTVS